MTQFARHASSQWSESESSSEVDSTTGGYSKQALKEMIEIKRRNDSVRRREFEELRKLRKRDPQSLALAQGRPSFFRSSMAVSQQSQQSDGSRHVTLKKIDEIEAQMSMQWWRGSKNATHPPDVKTDTSNKVAATKDASMLTPEQAAKIPTVTQVVDVSHPAQQSNQAVVRVTGSSLLNHPSSYGSTHHGADLDQQNAQPQPYARKAPPKDMIPTIRATLDGNSLLESDHVSRASSGASASASLERSSEFIDGSFMLFQSLPVWDDIAISFANGDSKDAEAMLLNLIASNPSLASDTEAWMMLFDFYRATKQQERFENKAMEFVNRFGRSAPSWVTFEPAQTSSAAHQVVEGAGFRWIASAMLNVQALDALKNALVKNPSPPWQFDWSRLKQIEVDALEVLTQLFGELGENLIQIRMLGIDFLLQIIEQNTVLEDRSFSPNWWLLRMELLRVLDRAEEFEQVALDYCVTYEVSPPSWIEPCCDCLLLNTDGQVAVLPAAVDSQLYSLGIDTENSEFVCTLMDNNSSLSSLGVTLKTHLSGTILDALPEHLPALNLDQPAAAVLIINCEYLMRMDFVATGSLLNWVTQWNERGTQVQFRQVHRVMAAFFHVLGIHEHAKILNRRD